MEQNKGRTRSARLEVRTTPAAQQVLTDRTEFVLDPEEQEAWEELNRRPARDLPRLREFMARSSPFADE